MLRICFLLITPQAGVVTIATFFTLFIKLSSKRFGLPFFLKTTSLSKVFVNLFFHEFTVVQLKLSLSYF